MALKFLAQSLNLKHFTKKSCRVSRECIPDNKQCDGEKDCEDESDEEGCEGQLKFIFSFHTFCYPHAVSQKALSN